MDDAMHSSGKPALLDEYADRVLSAAERIPPGRVMTYGDVAEFINQEAEREALSNMGGGVRREGGPRQVGRVMALYGGAVPWWRVVRADGRPLPDHEPEALEHYRVEGTPLRSTAAGAQRIDMRRARWDGGGDALAAHT